MGIRLYSPLERNCLNVFEYLILSRIVELIAVLYAAMQEDISRRSSEVWDACLLQGEK